MPNPIRKAPAVAVITRTKDRPVFLQRAIRSVLEQDFADWVHVIVNDGGDARTVDLLVQSFRESYADRVIVVHHAQSRCMQEASNAGINASDSTYLVIHDDDDSWEPEFLRKTVAFLEREGADSSVQGVATQSTQIVEEITISGQVRECLRQPYQPFAFVNIGDMRQRNLFPPIAFLYRRSAHEKLGLFRQEFDVLGDHDWNLRFLRRFEIGVLPGFHARYHWRHGSEGNTVTAGRETHRRMLSRFKNTYYREWLDAPEDAVGPVDEIMMPPPVQRDMGPFKLRPSEAAPAAPMPDLLGDYDFDVLSLDVFDTVLKRLCHHPKDVFRLLEARAVRELGLPNQPYATMRVRAEESLRQRLGHDLTLELIYGELARVCELKDADARALMQLELDIEEQVLYADPRWIAACKVIQDAGKRIIFVSDMYLTGKQIADLLSSRGFDSPEVFSSADLLKTKHDGELFAEVEAAIGVSGERILHVGDNFHSDCMRAIGAGWQAVHWSDKYGYAPWYAEVEPDYFVHDDTLSPLMMGIVRRRGEQQPWAKSNLLEKLGYEAAGPLYLAFMSWVLRQAKIDGVRRLVLLGRDGYYWEKALRMMADRLAVDLEFAYMHASRKVLNFASFDGVDTEALEFLLTPNPALRVCDFINRTGLDAAKYGDAIRTVGFSDPEQMLTNEMGGSYLDSSYPHRLQRLFQLLEGDLQKLFAADRAGVRQLLRQAGFNPADSAFVDIGWRASSVKPMPRILDLQTDQIVSGYYFGTWKEAETEQANVRTQGFFMDLGKPAENEALVRESVNWIESLHAAPYPTLLGLRVEGDTVVPEFSPVMRGGFNPDQQESIWDGARQFLQDALEQPQPPASARGGFAYIFLLLKRLICEPTPSEVAAWGSLEHSDGFGLEVYKSLIQPVGEDASAEQLMEAYRGSNWRRGFLASLSPEQRAFVQQRLEAIKPKTFEQLVSDLEFKIRQNDDLWSENSRLKFQSDTLNERLEELQDVLGRLTRANDKLEGDLKWKISQSDELWGDANRLKNELQVQNEATAAVRAELETHIAKLNSQLAELQTERDTRVAELTRQLGELHTERDTRVAELTLELGNRDARIAELTRELGDLSAALQQSQQREANLQHQMGELGEQINATHAHAAEQAQASEQQMAVLSAQLGAEITSLQEQLQSTSVELEQLRAAWQSRSRLLRQIIKLEQ